MPVTKITVALTGHESYDQIRILRPLRWPGMKEALWEAGVTVETLKMSEIGDSVLAGIDCFVFHGIASPGVMNMLKKMPCPFAVFEDDLMRPELIPEWNPNKTNAVQNQVLDYMLKEAVAIVCTTKPLADHFGYLDKCRVQGNLEDFQDIPRCDCGMWADGKRHIQRRWGRIVCDACAGVPSNRMKRAIFVGGNSHAGDLELLNDLQWSGKTVIWSSCLPTPRTAMYRDKMGNLVQKPDRADWGRIEPTFDYEKYQTYLANIAPSFGIGLAPLVACEFNRAKSILRFLEYTKCGWVTVASDVPPYSDIPNDVMLRVHKNTTWSELVESAKDYDNYGALSNRAWLWCRDNHSYQKQWRQWVDTWAWIASRV
jgi:hypothetical protein